MKSSLSESERKLISRLHEKEQFIEQVANHSPDIIYVLDLQRDKITYTNKRAQEIMGPDNMRLNEFHPDDQLLRRQHLEQCAWLDRNEMKDLTARMRVKNGEWRWFWIRDVAFKFDGAGRVTHTIGVMRDIQEKKRWANALMEQEKMLDAVLNAQSVSIVAYKAIRNSRRIITDFEFILVSRAFEDFHKRYDLPGKRVFEEFPMIRQLEYENWVRVIETGRTESREVSYPNPVTGKMHHFSMKLEKMGDGCLLLWEDITDKKQTENHKEDTLRLLHSVANSKSLGIAVTKAVRDIHGEIEDYEFMLVSSSGQEFLGRADLVGKRVFEEYPDLRETEGARLRSVVEDGRIYSYERTFPGPDGRETLISVKLEKAGDGYVAIWEDVGNAKRERASVAEDVATTAPRLAALNLNNPPLLKPE